MTHITFTLFDLLYMFIGFLLGLWLRGATRSADEGQDFERDWDIYND